MMSARDPYVNVMRGAMAAFAAGLGGADSVSVLPFTQAIGLPDARAPAGSQYAVDPATRVASGLRRRSRRRRRSVRGADARPVRSAWALFQEIEAEGGLPSALLSGAFQEKVAAGEGGARARRRADEDADHRRQRPSRSQRIAADVLPATPPSSSSPAKPLRRRWRRCAFRSLSSVCATPPTLSPSRARGRASSWRRSDRRRMRGGSASRGNCSRRAAWRRRRTRAPRAPTNRPRSSPPAARGWRACAAPTRPIGACGKLRAGAEARGRGPGLARGQAGRPGGGMARRRDRRVHLRRLRRGRGECRLLRALGGAV